MKATKVFGEKITSAIQDDESKRGRDRALNIIRPNMLKMVQKYPDKHNQLRAVKRESLNNMSDLVDQATAKLEENGCKVFIAKDAAGAQKYICNIVNQGPVVKSKSNVAKEIGLVEALEEKGLNIVETDLGDWINQLAKSKASHTLAPAIHIPAEKVRQMFSKIEGRELSGDIDELVGVARNHLRATMETARFGITGANAITADTGSVILTENEGNIRAVTTLPKVHIVVAGINKIVPTFEDGVLVVQSASIYGVGQDIGTYISVISGPAKSKKSAFGPEEVHVVLIDNGRSAAKEAGFEEAFYCINCGSCQNFCPVYDTIGNAFGKKYIGGSGVVQTAFTRSLAEAEESGLSACLSCGTCIQVCPNSIDTPGMISRLRSTVLAEKGMGTVKGYALNKVLRNQRRLEGAAGKAAKVKGILLVPDEQKRGCRARIGPAGFKNRVLPMPTAQSFLRTAPSTVKVSNPKMKVALYSGCLVNVAYTDVGHTALKVLKNNQVEVVVPKDQECCGLPMMVNGDMDTARELAKKNIDLLLEADADKVVNVCATCQSMLHDYPLLFAGLDEEYHQRAVKLADKVVDIVSLLVDELGINNKGLKFAGDPITVTYHNPCHLKDLRTNYGKHDNPRLLLSEMAGITFSECEGADKCCGFGGTVSFDHYNLTGCIGRTKAEEIAASAVDVVCTSCPGCMASLTDGLTQLGSDIKVKHMVELIAESDWNK
ncbi:LUD domain-containing protein [Metallumcola ferriviriculae]|uniref:LUD domain-containing protein n=1 Tax=Metallumcola ferriviriculae TaxID=3039180 RepID=A0AAU0UMQ1_9FIRM|nr:LUD domain-containing protein [Desulfitibacteraceae bacterium MK1]